MKGNTYISVNEATYEAAIPPELMAKYAREDQYGDKITTTFKEVGIDNELDYGPVIPLSYEGANYYLIELEASWKNGEISALIQLGEGLSYPNNTLLTINEAIAFVQSTHPNIAENEQ